MAQRHNHYDAAFEEFLRVLGAPYVNVDEAKRALFRQSSLKSMDFIVHSSTSPNMLIDVKGRRVAPGSKQRECWVTKDDIAGLNSWKNIFGSEFRPLLVFAYHLVDPADAQPGTVVFLHNERHYQFFGVWADHYQNKMKLRSPSWGTVYLPANVFRAMRFPFDASLPLEWDGEILGSEQSNALAVGDNAIQPKA